MDQVAVADAMTGDYLGFDGRTLQMHRVYFW